MRNMIILFCGDEYSKSRQLVEPIPDYAFVVGGSRPKLAIMTPAEYAVIHAVMLRLRPAACVERRGLKT